MKTGTYTFLTGATGMLGRYLLRDLLLAGSPVAVLVRGRGKLSAADRIETLLSHWEQETGRALPRPIILSGTLDEPGLGLAAEQTQWIRRHCRSVIHSAASLRFSSENQEEEPWRTNVGGTDSLLALCRSLGIPDFHQVSTAYVAGHRNGPVREDELDAGQQWGNAYEESKAEAEKRIRASGFLQSATVYRPSIIVGDSGTGYASAFHGVYTLLRAAHALASKLSFADSDQIDFPALFGLKGDERKNLVPVDWVSAAFVEIFSRPQLHGLTYHLTSPAPTPVSALQEAFLQVLRPLMAHGTRLNTPDSLAGLRAALLQQMGDYRSYWRDDPEFDRGHADAALPDLPCPRMDRARLLKLARYALDSRFGLKPPKNVRASDRSQRWFERMAQSNLRIAGFHDTRGFIGVNLTGPGGSQWQVELQFGRVVAVTPGLPQDPTLIFYLPWRTFQRIAMGQLQAADALESGRALVMGGGTLDCETLVRLLEVFALQGDKQDQSSQEPLIQDSTGNQRKRKGDVSAK